MNCLKKHYVIEQRQIWQRLTYPFNFVLPALIDSIQLLMKNNPFKLKYVPTTGIVILFYLLLFFTLYLLLAKKYQQFRLPFVPFTIKDFYSHVSNFIISYNIVAAIAFIWLLQGASLKMCLWLCLAFIIINIGVERFVTVLNTRDIMDAGYGIAGTLLAFCFAWIVKQSGLKEYQQPLK